MKWPTKEEIEEIKKKVGLKEDKDIASLKRDSKQWIRTAWDNKTSYEITWLGVPIIQLPEDMIIMQELIFDIKPDVIIECGIALGGSLIYYSSILEILGKGKVIGVDIEIKPHNRRNIENHPMSKRITLIEGSSIDKNTVDKVKKQIEPNSKILVCLDSNHTKAHVLEEIKLYCDLVSKGSYLVVMDTVLPDLKGLSGSKDDWDKNNPLEAIKEFLATNKEFEIDKSFGKLFVTHFNNGFLRKK